MPEDLAANGWGLGSKTWARRHLLQGFSSKCLPLWTDYSVLEEPRLKTRVAMPVWALRHGHEGLAGHDGSKIQPEDLRLNAWARWHVGQRWLDELRSKALGTKG